MSPHFGLTKADREIDNTGYLLERAQLHFRTGKFLLTKGNIIHGYVTLFDSLISGFEYYISKNKGTLLNTSGFDLTNYPGMYSFLNSENILDFDFSFFDKLLSDALDFNLKSIDVSNTISEIERILVSLKICPFDETLLPPIQEEFLK